MLLIGAAAVGVAAAFPRLILSLLGPQYLHLESELVWMMAASAITLLASAVYLLNTARGWVRGLWLGVPATIAAQIAVALYIDLSTVKGAILLQASAFAAPLLVNVAIGVRGLRALSARDATAAPVAGPEVRRNVGD
jgi:hypothetical protein